MKTIIFMDIDGTLITSIDGQQYIPPSAIESIKKARNNGALIYLCTGRSKAEIGDLMDIGFDGIIGAAGGYIEHQNKVLYHKTLHEDSIKMIQEYLDANHVNYYLECNSGLYCSESFRQYMIQDYFKGDEDNSFLKIMKDLKDVNYHDVNKISFLSQTISYDDVFKQFGEEFAMVKASWGDDFKEAGEISNKGINKATAIHFLLDYLNLEEVKTYGFGDSMNDIEMFKCVDIAIAMGDARHGIKELATFVTKDLLDDGIEYAMKKYNLI